MHRCLAAVDCMQDAVAEQNYAHAGDHSGAVGYHTAAHLPALVLVKVRKVSSTTCMLAGVVVGRMPHGADVAHFVKAATQPQACFSREAPTSHSLGQLSASIVPW
jgi:hypothetical protein